MSSKSLLSILTGQRMAIRVVGKSYGIQRPSLVDSADWTPNLSIQTLLEFDNLRPALIYSTFDDVTFKMGYPQNNQQVIESVLMDSDPTLDALLVDPSNMTPFTVFANAAGQDGHVKGSWLVLDITPNGNPFTGTPKDAAKRTLDGKGLWAFYQHGLAIAYTRFRGNKPLTPPPSQPALTQSASGGTLGTDTYYVVITAVTALGESTPSGEASIQVTSGSANELTVTTPAITTPVTGYNVYVSNRSGGWRFSQLVSSGTSATITTLPPTNAAKPPVTNTTGVPTATNDVVMTASGNVWSGALSTPALQNPQNGLAYLVVKKNGITIAQAGLPATEDTFSISSDGTTFSVLDPNGADDWYDVWTPYKPSPL